LLEQPGADRGAVDAEALGGFADIEPFDCAQHEDRAEVVRQRIDGVLEQCACMRRFDELVRGGFVARRGLFH
jgi:hypothetical protein